MLLRMLKKGLSLYCFRICMEYISRIGSSMGTEIRYGISILPIMEDQKSMITRTSTCIGRIKQAVQ